MDYQKRPKREYFVFLMFILILFHKKLIYLIENPIYYELFFLITIYGVL
jgi:hypothetical protein